MASRLKRNESSKGQGNTWAEASTSLLILPSNRPVKNLCLIFMTGSAILTILAQDVWFILHSIIGIIIAVEGLHGVSKFDPPTLRRFMVVLVVSASLALAVGITEVQSVDEYCSTAPVEEADTCTDTIIIYYVSFMAVQSSLGFVLALVVSIFHKAILDVQRKSRGDNDLLLDNIYFSQVSGR